MIRIGLTPREKLTEIAAALDGRDAGKVVFCSPAKFAFDASSLGVPTEWIDWPEIIMYRTFYRLLQEIDQRTLVVVNECLRTQNRYDLTYNCIRHFLRQAGHVAVFQWLPCIDTMQDFMTLFDFATGSRYKRERYAPGDLPEAVDLRIEPRAPRFVPLPVRCAPDVHARYAEQRAALFAGLGARDPHTLPRQLHLLSGPCKRLHLAPMTWHVARNARLGRELIATYGERDFPHAPYRVVEWPHDFIDFADFACLAGQADFEALVADTPADQWYMQRYAQWAQRIADGIADLRPGA